MISIEPGVELHFPPEIELGGASSLASQDGALHVANFVAQIVPCVATPPGGGAADAPGSGTKRRARLGSRTRGGKQGGTGADRDAEGETGAEQGKLFPAVAPDLRRCAGGPRRGGRSGCGSGATAAGWSCV
ncbi:MAG: hypothetical protein ABIV10_07970 [Gemmatimonadaceae bacterium]